MAPSFTAERTAFYLPALFDTDVDLLLNKQPLVVECVVQQPDENVSRWLWPLFPIVDVVAQDWRSMVTELQRQTRWSDRALAAVLSTSHTTIAAIKRGRFLDARRSGDLGERLKEASSVISRVFHASGDSVAATRRVLNQSAVGGQSAAALLTQRRPNAAYVAALDSTRPRQPGLLVGDYPRMGDATSPLSD